MIWLLGKGRCALKMSRQLVWIYFRTWRETGLLTVRSIVGSNPTTPSN